MQNLPILINTSVNYHPVLELTCNRIMHCSGEKLENFIINTDDAYVGSFNFQKVIVGDKFNWCDRFRNALITLESEFVLCLFDDYYPATIDMERLSKVADIITRIKSDVSAIYLCDLNFELGPDDNCLALPVVKQKSFSVNSGAAIWRRRDLIQTLVGFNDPWSWEAYGHRNLEFNSKFLVAEGVYNYSQKTGGLIYRGHLVATEINTVDLKNAANTTLSHFPRLSNIGNQSRSIRWKLRFLLIGLRVKPLGLFDYLVFYIKKKYF